MATINLAPGAQYISRLRRRRTILYSVAVAVVLVVAGAWAGLYAATASAVSQQEAAVNQLQVVERTLAELSGDIARIESFESRLAALDTLLGSHVNWAPIFAELERLLPPPVALTAIRMSTTAPAVVVSGRVPAIDDIAQTIATLVTSPSHSTLFSSGELKSMQRREEVSAEGAPPNVLYVFEATFPFTPTAIRADGGL